MRFSVLVRKSLSLSLSFLVFAMVVPFSAFAAEVRPFAEVVVGGGPQVVTVKQGTTATFAIKIGVYGDLDAQANKNNPSTVSVASRFTIAGGAVQALGMSDAYGIWVDKGVLTGQGGTATQTAPATITVPAATTPGTYTYTYTGTGAGSLVITNKNDHTVPPLENVTADTIVFNVVWNDDAPPATSASVAGTKGANDWYTNQPVVTLSATDNAGSAGIASGIERTEYKVGSGAWQTYSSPATISAEGVSDFYYRSIDKAGNVETAKQLRLKVDTIAPALTISSPAEGDYVHDAAIVYSGSDANYTGASAEIDTASFTGSVYSDEGRHTLVVTASDEAGHETVRSVRFTVDRTAPRVTFTSPLRGGFFNTAQTVAFDVTDNLDPAPFVSPTIPNGTLLSAEGAYTASVDATDHADNHGRASLGFSIDKTPPFTAASPAGTPGNGSWWRSNVTVTLSPSDDRSPAGISSGVASTSYRIDGGAWTTGLAAHVSGDGSHTFQYKSIDVAGNEEPVESETFDIDTHAPSLSVRLDGTEGLGGWYLSPVSVTAEGADVLSGVAGYEYDLDSGGWLPLVGPLVVGAGEHAVSVRCTDGAGNTSAEVHRSFKVDLTKPVTVATPAPPDGENGWYRSAAHIVFDATDSGSGIARTEWSTNGVDWTPCGSAVDIADEGVTTLLYRSVDSAGNVEDASSVTIAIDSTPPDLTVTGIHPGDYVFAADIGVMVSDHGSGPTPASMLLDGVPFAGGLLITEYDHVLVASAVDIAGNRAEQVVAFTIDRTKPAILISWPRDSGIYRSSQDFDFSVTDHDPQVHVDWSHPLGTSFSEEGAYTEWVGAADRAGNADTSTISFMIDKTPPVTTTSPRSGDKGNGVWWKSDVTLGLNAGDPVSNGVASGVQGSTFSVGPGEPAEYVDAEGIGVSAEGTTTVTCRSTDVAGNVESLKSADVCIDKSKPTASLRIEGTVGGGGWYVTAPRAIASGEDAVSGLDHLEYDLDGRGFGRYSGPVTIPEGTHTLTARGVDAAGNTGDGVAEGVRVDLTPPTTECRLPQPQGANDWYTSDVEVWLGAEDNADGSGVAGIDYSINDGADWEHIDGASGSFTFGIEGQHAVRFRSTDAAGNVENAGSVLIKLDKHDPVPSIDGIAEGAWVFEATPTVGASDSSPGSGLDRAVAVLDGSDFVSGSIVTGEGDHTLTVTGFDAAGRSASKTVRFTIDRTAPRITILHPADGGRYNSDQRLGFGVTDSDRLACFDSTYENGHLFSDEGAYIEVVTASDRAGNSSSARVDFMIDRTPPSTGHTLYGTHGDNDWFKSSVRVELNAEDPEHGGVASGVGKVEYRVNGGGWADCPTGGFVVSGEGDNLVEYRSQDIAGNQEAAKSVHVRVDTKAPEPGSITPADGVTYGYGTSLTIGYSAGDPVSGVASCKAWLNRVEVKSGDTVKLTQPGRNVFVVEACDGAGNPIRIERTFNVAFSFGGFLSPTALDHVWNAGRTLPVKFVVKDGSGKPTSAATARVEVSKNGQVVMSGAATPNGEASFYQYNLNTPKTWLETYRVTVILNDGTVVGQDVTFR